MSTHKVTLRRILAMVIMLAVLLVSFAGIADFSANAAKATLTVDMTDEKHEIIHGAAGFLYGISNEDVPTTNTLVPLKPKILATKGALGTEHPYGDALDVAKTFLESGGEQVQMYNSNYYGVFGVTADYLDYSAVLKDIIAPAVVEWKNAWNEEHGTPENPKDNIGKKIDIDKAIVYIPINEGTPIVNAPGANQNERFSNAWKSYYDAIRAADPKASIAGPNCWGYNATVNYRYFVRYCADNNCMPDVYTWHELDRPDLRDMKAHMEEFRRIWKEEITDKGGVEETPQIVINEYAEMIDCGVPGRLVNWIARLEDEEVYGCLPFWHQANNLNDLTADANEGNGAWWVYKWYGDMSGQTLGVETNTAYDALYGLATIDDAKQISNVILGGVDGSASVVLKNVDKTTTFGGASKVHVKVESTSFTGFHGAQTEVPVIIDGVFPLESDGSVIIELSDMKFATAYNVTLTKVNEDMPAGEAMVSKYQKVYESEDALLLDGASVVSHWNINPVYYFSGERAVSLGTDSELIYEIEVPTDGKYKLDFNYGNGTGSNRNNMYNHSPLNVEQVYKIDDNTAKAYSMKSTLLSNMTGIFTLYEDLTAGRHTIAIKTTGDGVVLHDMLTVTYSGAYEQPVKKFNTKYEAEQADFNRLSDNTASSVITKTDISGYSGNGYVTGINSPSVVNGGGIRWNVIVEESGLYDFSLRYCSEAASANINVYVGNTATTLDKLVKAIPAEETSGEWNVVSATLYLQKGINIVDVDASSDISLDYLRVKEIPSEFKTGTAQSVVIEAESAVPSGSNAEILESSGASGGKYVKGLEGDINARTDINKYLEFTYNAPESGYYEMQIFQSNDEICGSHSYNTKIIDKYATVEVSKNGDVKSAERKFFINTFSNDTFKEKTVTVYFEAGENSVKIYNDDSWQVLWGGTTSVPGTNELDNFTPNFDKFIITPSTLATPVELLNEYLVDIKTTNGGYAIADKDVVQQGEDVTITFFSEKDVEKVTVNGVEKTSEILDNKLSIANVNEDIEVQVVFTERHNEHVDKYINNAGFGTGNLTDWTAADAEVLKDAENTYDGYFAKVSGTLEQEVKNVPAGLYNLIVYSKGYAENSGKATLSAAGKTIDLMAADEYMENIIRLEIKDGDSIQILVDANELSNGICLDNFSLIPVEPVNPDLVNVDLEYFVDAGDHDPKTLSENDKFGVKNSVTDKLYGVDRSTGYKWGLVYSEADTPISVSASSGVYTTYQWANENNKTDGLDKLTSFRYAHNQIENGISPRYVKYSFELEPGVYEVEAAFGNTWNNAGAPSLYVDNALLGTANVNANGNEVIKGEITLSEAGEILVEGRTNNATIQLNYIKIMQTSDFAKTGNLQKAYEKAEPIENNADDPYLDDLWTAFENARDAAKALLDETNILSERQAEIDAAEQALTSAQQALKKYADLYDEDIEYFVDAGDHWTGTLSGNDKFGVRNSVTDQIFGADPATGKLWGVYDYLDLAGENVNGTPAAPGAYTKYTWGNENSGDSANWADGSAKTSTFRYARSQDGSAEVKNTVGEIYVDYKFELEPNTEYEITVGIGNHWGNSSPVSVYTNRGIGSEIS